jgi:hydrogenase nickel incorporation protein HypA/HybF
MHERSLVRALLRQVEKLASEHPGSHVLTVRVRIGEFSGVDADLLAIAYEDMARNTLLRDAVLDMERVQLKGLCDQCGNQFRIDRFRFQCDKCGSAGVSLCGGEELQLDSVTLEEIGS